MQEQVKRPLSGAERQARVRLRAASKTKLLREKMQRLQAAQDKAKTLAAEIAALIA